MIQRNDQPFAEALQGEIAARLTEQQFQTWFSRVRFQLAGPGQILILVPNRFHQTFLKHRFIAVILESIETVTNLQQPQVHFEIDDVAAEETSPAPVLSAHPQQAQEQYDTFPANIPLNPGYTFDQFITGPANRLAHAAALSVAENPGAAYNPLFIYGSVGLGKTHLLQAVGHTYLKLGYDRLVYLSCASFTDDFISALGRNELEQFRSKYREADALLIDDIQFLANKERTQEEFFHTFNSIYNQQKQIFLTSDSLPSEIVGLGERLISRFRLGLVAQLSPPSLETRVAILIRKGKNLNLEISTEIAELVAHKIRDNVRELEGAVLRIHSLVCIEKKPLTIEGVRDALADLLGNGNERLNLLKIQQAVLEEFDVRPGDLHSKKRTRSIVIPRQVCMYLARKLTDLSLGEIGGYFGGRDHSTVLHAIEKIRQFRGEDRKVRASLETIEKRLGR